MPIVGNAPVNEFITRLGIGVEGKKIDSDSDTDPDPDTEVTPYYHFHLYG
jgi:hypothetical protein